ncbi:Hypothetical protein A7982_09279 [Minicystis rosea]|nr:Hypothetical protein A7982_09279 [Minicystis rosea]
MCSTMRAESAAGALVVCSRGVTSALVAALAPRVEPIARKRFLTRLCRDEAHAGRRCDRALWGLA